MTDISSASYETKDESLASAREFVRFWLDAIEAASKEEKEWREEAGEVIDIYRGEEDAENQFNIVYSNVETLIPAIYNSTPVPDIRRRYNDKDKLGKTVADILERSLTYSLDSYDFDGLVRSVLFDAAIPGRGLARVRYVPTIADDGQSIEHEECVTEYVPWKHFRHGAARVWEEVPWVAFEHFLSRDQLRGLSPELADKVQLDCSTRGEDADEQKSDIFKRARVWEVWDKEAGEVVFIATGYGDGPLKRETDPLGLTGFWPCPKPIQFVATPGKLCPVTPYKAYRQLAEELNDITFRIKRLVKQIRVKGGYAAAGADLTAIARADDGDLVPLEQLEIIASGGGDLNKLIAWWPIEPTVKALAQLYQQREAVKQTIYEVTGISDIVRGQSVSNETATAQQIKNQWGSLRIQRLQAEVQRFCRDIFRLKAEIYATQFDMQRLAMVTGIDLLPGEQIQMAQQAIAMAQQNQKPPPPGAEEAAKATPIEQIEQIMRSDIVRSYRIDVESDSTIRADLTRNQEQMAGFLQGTAQFLSAVGPAVQAGQMPPDVAVEIYSAFARSFKLGKQAESALDRMAEDASKPQPPKPDPAQIEAEARMKMEEQKLQIDAQSKQRDAQLAQAKMQADMQMAQAKAEFDMGLAREKAGQEYQLKLMQVQADIEIKRMAAANNAQLQAEANAMKAENDREAARNREAVQ